MLSQNAFGHSYTPVWMSAATSYLLLLDSVVSKVCR